MPLTPLQQRVLRTLRGFRSEQTYIGGGAALNQGWPRLSDDMDIFGDDSGSLPAASKPELEALEKAGFTVHVTTHDERMVEAIVREYGFETRVQWINDPETSRRFFPAIHDDDMGFKLHPADTAVNKLLCAARRHSAPRDAVDLVSIATRYAPLGPLVWCLAGKDASLNPRTALTRIRGIVFGYSDEEIRAVRMEGEAAMTRQDVRRVLETALEEAAAYCDDIAPDDYLGCLFVDADDTPVAANETTLSKGIHRAVRTTDFGRLPRFDDRQA
ncbi:MAG: hypothetical protein JWQ58_3104 [Reyranella sp.]|nr:hypothetical protein [Reyranella sp.]